VQVLGGVYSAAEGDLARFGFSGGGFDQLLMRSGAEGTIGDMRIQVLQLDSIGANAVAVPEPGTLALLGLALGAWVVRRKMSPK